MHSRALLILGEKILLVDNIMSYILNLPSLKFVRIGCCITLSYYHNGVNKSITFRLNMQEIEYLSYEILCVHKEIIYYKS